MTAFHTVNCMFSQPFIYTYIYLLKVPVATQHPSVTRMHVSRNDAFHDFTSLQDCVASLDKDQVTGASSCNGVRHGFLMRITYEVNEYVEHQEMENFMYII